MTQLMTDAHMRHLVKSFCKVQKINISLFSSIHIFSNFRGVGRNFSGGAPIPISRSQVQGSGGTAPSCWEGLDFVIITFCLKFVIKQFKDTVILYNTLDIHRKIAAVFSLVFTLSQMLIVYGKELCIDRSANLSWIISIKLMLYSKLS